MNTSNFDEMRELIDTAHEFLDDQRPYKFLDDQRPDWTVANKWDGSIFQLQLVQTEALVSIAESLRNLADLAEWYKFGQA